MRSATRARESPRARSEVVLLGLVAQGIEHGAGLHAGHAGDRVQLQHAVEVLHHLVDDDGHVGALAREVGAAAAQQEQGAVLAADAHCL